MHKGDRKTRAGKPPYAVRDLGAVWGGAKGGANGQGMTSDAGTQCGAQRRAAESGGGVGVDDVQVYNVPLQERRYGAGEI